MILGILVLLFALTLYKLEIRDNSDYLGIEQSTAINGLFIIIVFLSHANSYVNVTGAISIIYIWFFALIGQMMVVMFLFYSGYGLTEQYKKRGDLYLNGFIKRRVVKTWIHFVFALLIYVAISLCLRIPHSSLEWIFCWIGWLSIGNSNWYVFDILVLYIIFYSAMIIAERYKKSISRGKVILTITWTFTIGFWILMYFMKGPAQYWYNTLLAFPFGVTVSLFNDIVDYFFKEKRKWVMAFSICVMLFFAFYLIRNSVGINISAILFSLLIVLASMKIKIGNKVFIWTGSHLFYIYFLQRIPMILFEKIGLSDWPVLFIGLSFLLTILLTNIFSRAFDVLDKKLQLL